MTRGQERWEERPTVGPRRLLARPQREERPPLRLEAEVALECRNALVHRRELVRVARAEGRALRGVARVEREEGRDLFAGRSGEEVIAQVLEEVVVGAAGD